MSVSSDGAGLGTSVIVRAVDSCITCYRSVGWLPVRPRVAVSKNNCFVGVCADTIYLFLVIHAIKECENGDDYEHAKRKHFGEWRDGGCPFR